MKFHWLISGVVGAIGALMVAAPGYAGQLQTWSYDRQSNQLVFSTTSGVQPRAQLIFNPTRVVIDLPGTTLGRSQINQFIGTEIQEVRIGQFDSQTTRIVIELSPGYVVDPQQVVVQGATPTQWSVQLPTPQLASAIAPSPSLTPSPSLAPSPNLSQTPPIAGATTRLENVRVTPDGFFLRTTGSSPTILAEQDEGSLVLELANTVLSPQLLPELPINRYGVSRMTFVQLDTVPPTAQVTLELAEDAPEWRASASGTSGVILLPQGGVVASELETLPADLAEVPPAEVNTSLPVIQAIALQNNDTQLVIRADGPLRYTSQWDRASNRYEITISGARLAERVSGPTLGATSPLSRVRLRQEGTDTVIIQVEPAAGVQVGPISQPSQQLVSVNLVRDQAIAVPPPSTPGPATPPYNTPSYTFPQDSNERVVVVIDPGHGGPDPGAVGIGGLQEKGVVLSISTQVAALLEQQGIMAVLTRPDDRDLDLQPRVDLAEQVGADLFVSIHANAIDMSRPEVNGLETYYYSDAGLRLARVLHNSMVSMGEQEDRGIRQARFYVLVNTSMPAVLLETGFVTGAEDAALLSDPSFRSRMAAAIASGIAQYVRQNF